jgi:hypothetical protein
VSRISRLDEEEDKKLSQKIRVVYVEDEELLEECYEAIWQLGYRVNYWRDKFYRLVDSFWY